MHTRPILFLIGWLIPALLFSQSSGPEIEPGVFYLKIREEWHGSDPASGKKVFSLSQFETEVIYLSRESLKKTNSNSRTDHTILDGLYKVHVTQNVNLDSLILALSKFDNVAYVEPVYLETIFYTPNDPQIINGNQPYLETIRAFDAWDLSKGSKEVVIGIVDTGLDLDHEEIRNKLYHNAGDPQNGVDDDNNGYIDDYTGFDFADNDSIAQCDPNFHGNRVGGLAGAETDNGQGIAGVGFEALICPLKIFRSTDNNSHNAYDAILYAADNGIDILNLSWGSENSYSQAAQDIINYAVLEKDVVIIAAAGNTPEDLKFYPASYDNVLSVGATDNNDLKASFSTYNISVDLVAPGKSIYSTFKENGYSTDGGTSYSAPMVAGAAALVRSLYPDLNARQVMELIRVSSDEIYRFGTNSTYQEKMGKGRLNVFKTLAQTGQKAARITNFTYETSLGSEVFYDDTVSLSFQVTNYLSPLADLRVTLSSPSEYVTFLKNEINIGALDSLGAVLIDDKFLVLHEDTPPETTVLLRFGFDDNSYDDFQYAEFTTHPDHINFGNDQLQFTISGNGNLGYQEDGFKKGIGLLWNGKKVLSHAGFLAGVSASELSDNLPTYISSNVREQDFNVIRHIRHYPSETAEYSIHSTFLDDSAANPLELSIDQKAFAPADDSFLILEYRVVNRTADTLKDLVSGIYLDWDLMNRSQNRSAFDPDNNILYTVDKDSTQFAGCRTPGNQFIYQALDLFSTSGNTADLEDELNDSIKYTLASSLRFDSAGISGNGNDVADLLADTLTLLPFRGQKVAFFVALASTYNNLNLLLDRADSMYQKILSIPSLLETYVSCEGAALEIDPQSGDRFRFYSDPLGTQVISEGDTLITGPISMDTTFYLQNLDSVYEGDIQRLDIRLVDDVADFSLNTDTLYLDHSINTVTFTDQSFRPDTWFWDFDNGVQATVRNPVVNFSSPGNYEISLTVTNELGCTGSRTKMLLVAERPEKPQLDALTVCRNQSFNVAATNADSIALYLYADSPYPIIESGSVFFEGFSTDTCFYATNITGPFESTKQKFCIEVDAVRSRFTYRPDTIAVEPVALFLNTSQHSANVVWYIDHVFAGTAEQLPLLIEKAEYTIALVAKAFSGCTDSVSQTIHFAASPTPIIQFDMTCYGERAVISPTNGHTFGFYSDPDLDNLIKKGQRLEMDSVIYSDTVFVVGLDSILPSAPVEVIIDPVLNDFFIVADPDTLFLSEGKTASLSASEADLVTYAWYLGGRFIESAPEPILFFDTVGSYEIVLEAMSNLGCTALDTIWYLVQDHQLEESPLKNPDEAILKLYPNPTNGKLLLESLPENCTVTVTNLSGKIILNRSLSSQSCEIDFSGNRQGIYFMTITSGQGTVRKKIQLNK